MANRETRRAASAKERANPHRGESVLHLANGDTVKLKLTLNALVEIEEAFGCPIGDVGKRLNGNVSMKDLRTFLAPLVRGGGMTVTVPDLQAREFGDASAVMKRPPTDEEVGALEFDIHELGRAIRAVMQANLSGDPGAQPEAGEGEAPARGN